VTLLLTQVTRMEVYEKKHRQNSNVPVLISNFDFATGQQTILRACTTLRKKCTKKLHYDGLGQLDNAQI